MEDKATNANQASGNASGKRRQSYVRSQYLFPVYDMNAALEVANKIDTQGAGTLSEASLAMALGLSAKSSGFALRVATAKQFGLVERRGGNLHTTELVKGVLRSIGENEKKESLAYAFYNIPLFKAISQRFSGVPLPGDNDLRNLLEREFGVKRDRIGQAFSTLMNSAKIAGVLQESQGKVYLLPEPSALRVTRRVKQEEDEKHLPPYEPPPSGQGIGPITTTWNVSVDTKDFAGMDAEAIKAAMDGLERIAKIVVLKQKIGEESGGKEE